jgi:NHLM bacteriocin system ABC transporter ATP-binding protein
MPLSLTLTTDEPQTAWLLQSGKMDVFAIALTNDAEGLRRYLFSVTAGEVLFTIPTNVPPASYKIVAVAIEAPTLVQLTPTELEQTARRQNLVSLAKRWRDHLNGVISNVGISLPSIDANSENALPDVLANLHDEFLQGLTQLEHQELQRKRIQLQDRERFDRQVTTQALDQLTAILSPRSTASGEAETALLTAMGAVGRAAGIVIRPPAQLDRVTEPSEMLEEIARASRIRMRRIVLDDGWWQTDCGALLGYMEADDRPVALLPIAAGKYELFDPETRTRSPINQRTVHQLSPSAYTFYRSLPQRVETALDLLKFALAGRTKEGITILWTGIATVGLAMLTPLATALLIDVALSNANRSLLWQIGLGLLAASVGGALFQLAQRRVTLRVETIADLTTQAALWDRLLTLKVSFFRQYAMGDLKSRVLSINQIRSLLGGVTLSTIFTSLFSLLNLVFLFFYSVHLAAVAVVVVFIALLVTNGVRLATLRYFRPLQALEGSLFGTMVQIIGGVAKLRVAGAENRAFAYWSTLYGQQLRLTLRTQFLEDLLAVFNGVLPTVSSIVLFGLAAVLIHQFQTQGTGLSTGAFLGFNVAFGTFIAGATSLSNTIVKVLEAGILWERTQPILNAEPEVDERKADPGQLEGQLLIDRLTFRYREEGPRVLDQVTLEAKAGEFIALVGASGSGKSTILRSILGFETPESGTIYYDGQDLSGLDVSAVRRQLGVVLQNGRINSNSIFENIANGALVTLEDVWEAAHFAGFADDIQAMPMGMHTVIAEGGLNLSGGQRQRLLIARALVLKPKILLMDEATSALDNRTQEIVSRNLEQLQVTRLVIAHRLSTIRHADRIYVLDRGQVVQQGTFDQLANQPGLFQTLMARQIV